MKPAMLQALSLSIATLLVGSVSAVAHAAEPEASGEATAASTSAAPAAEATAGDGNGDDATPWIRRWAPERNMAEVGLYGGLLFPSRRIELFEADFALPEQGHKPLARIVPEVGLRLGYYPLSIFGVEVEGGVMPGRTEAGDSVLLWAGRGNLVGQLGRYSVAPFILVGGGLIGVSSDRSALGNDVDASAHFGGGVKLHLARLVQLRLDVRDVVAAGQGYQEGVVHNAEVLLGLTVTLGRNTEPPPPTEAPPPPDTDGDGVLDPDDQCKDQPGVLDYQGCPIPDTDGDGVLDPDDQCKDQPGDPAYQGCPIPDTDGDGVLDPDDQCKDQPGDPAYQGCPIPDSDGDGILDPDDQCKGAPETINGLEDEDGCPDELPPEVVKFTGVIEGIYFDTGKSTIRRKSFAVLNQAIDVLRRYPTLKVEISGHTDNRGATDFNRGLAQARADAVKQFMVDQGIATGRITTRGAGPDEPIADNKTKRGRAKNRRIEFKLLTQ